MRAIVEEIGQRFMDAALEMLEAWKPFVAPTPRPQQLPVWQQQTMHAQREMQDLMKVRTRGCLVNAVGDLLQGNEAMAVGEMRRLELLAEFARGMGGLLPGSLPALGAEQEPVL